MFWGKQISVIPSESYMQMKIKCKSIILMSLWDVLMSNFFCINSGAKMLSLFQSTPQSLPMLSSCRSHFLLWKTSLFLHFSLGLVQNKSHWKNVQTWGEKRSPTYFKALETNCGKWHKSPASQEQLMWVGWGGRVEKHLSCSQRTKQCAAALPAGSQPFLSAGSPTGTDITEQKENSLGTFSGMALMDCHV